MAKSLEIVKKDRKEKKLRKKSLARFSINFIEQTFKLIRKKGGKKSLEKVNILATEIQEISWKHKKKHTHTHQRHDFQNHKTVGTELKTCVNY